jgi:hypothetical protein
MKMNKCYSSNGEEYYDDLGEVLDHITYYIDEDSTSGLDTEFGYYEGDAVHPEIRGYISEYSLVESISEAVSEDHGEWADSWFEELYQHRDALKELVAKYIEEHIPMEFYAVKNVVEKTITKRELLGLQDE